MLGHQLMRQLPAQVETWGSVRGPTEPQNRLLGGVEAENLDSLRTALDQVQPQVVINAIGLIKQLNGRRADLIYLNALFPHRLLELCQARQVRLIHLSTDCVFSGRVGNYRESDVADPLDDYGRTKLLGELEAVGALTLRTSIIGRERPQGLGLIEWFHRQRGGTVRGFRRALYSGLTTAELGRLLLRLIVEFPGLDGLWHVASQSISKFDLLYRYNELAGLGIEVVPSDDFVCDRSLNGQRFESETGYQAPSWETMLAELVRSQ
jgi:dTDP-4-dehydrorhamnose reductase